MGQIRGKVACGREGLRASRRCCFWAGWVRWGDATSSGDPTDPPALTSVSDPPDPPAVFSFSDPSLDPPVVTISQGDPPGNQPDPLTPVPERSTVALFASGLGALVVLRRSIPKMGGGLRGSTTR